MSTQIAVRIPDDVVAGLRQLVANGTFPTMADAIREGARLLIRERDERAIIEGYRRFPPTGAEQTWAERAGRELIAEEPWPDRGGPR